MFKIIKIFILVVIGAGIFYGGFYIGASVSRWYLWKNKTQWVRDLADDLKRLEKEDYERAMADTFGGKTPQETLQMFIDAVEKGDYELASRYFIIERQKKELDSLNNSNTEDIESIMNILKNTEPANEVADTVIGEYYHLKAKVKNEVLYISFQQYPNGIWKLTDI